MTLKDLFEEALKDKKKTFKVLFTYDEPFDPKWPNITGKGKATSSATMIVKNVPNAEAARGRVINTQNEKYDNIKITRVTEVPSAVTEAVAEQEHPAEVMKHLGSSYKSYINATNGGDEEGKKYNKVLAGLGFTEMEVDRSGKPNEAVGPKLNINTEWKRIAKDEDGTYYVHNKNPHVVVKMPSDSYDRAYKIRELFIGRKKSS